MPDFDVYIDHQDFVLNKTRTVRVPYDANPVTAADAPAAIEAVAAVTLLPGTYVAEPAGQSVSKAVTFDKVPVLTDPA